MSIENDAVGCKNGRLRARADGDEAVSSLVLPGTVKRLFPLFLSTGRRIATDKPAEALLILFGGSNELDPQFRLVDPTNYSKGNVQRGSLVRKKNTELYVVTHFQRMDTCDQTSGKRDIQYSPRKNNVIAGHNDVAGHRHPWSISSHHGTGLPG